MHHLYGGINGHKATYRAPFHIHFAVRESGLGSSSLCVSRVLKEVEYHVSLLVVGDSIPIRCGLKALTYCHYRGRGPGPQTSC
jgi:hypothetical protein